MEKEKFEQMLKEYLKSNAKIELVIDEDKNHCQCQGVNPYCCALCILCRVGINPRRE